MSRRLLWAYPADFRRRYGDELLATMAEVAGDRPPGLRSRILFVAAGLRQRVRVPLRPWVIVAAVLATVALAGAGAVGGRWLGWQTGADVPSREGLRSLTDGMGVYWPVTEEMRTAMGGPTVWAIANGPEVPDRARATLEADGWTITSYETPYAAIRVYDEDAADQWAAVPAHTVMFRAVKGGLTLTGDSLTGGGTTMLRVDIRADEAAAVRPFTVGGLVLGALTGWLLAAATASRVRRTGRARRRLITAQAAAVFAAAAVPTFDLYRVFVRTMTYDSDAANPTYVLEGQLPPALIWSCAGLAAIALGSLFVVVARGARPEPVAGPAVAG